ncbi:hypothetical protein BpHYR1_000291 [Brachionus plicatilis]|uniref:Uncharacterized protein n=1 Tax=Brachionus plicatilis TaxID=10195 RepID=A0A3M7P3U8_BRAPC|nr:hypothetical protein BpHYR1_000291 [Brachionus plicatilis]
MSGVTTSSITKHGSGLTLTWKFDSAVFTTSLKVGCSNTEKKKELSLSQMPSLSVMIWLFTSIKAAMHSLEE